MANKITFEDKVTKNVSSEEDKYKITAKDVNEIKTAVNENAEKIESHYIPTTIQNDSAWYLALSGNIVGYDNNAFILSIQQTDSGNAGQLYVNIRCNNSNSLALAEFKWLSNTGLNSSDFKLVLDGNNYYLYMKTPMNYGQYQIKVVQATSLQEKNEKILTFYTPDASESVEEPDGINPTGGASAITAYLSDSQTAPSDAATLLNLDTINCKVGEDLSLQENTIVCNKSGVVEIGAMFIIGNLKANGNTIPRVYKNNTMLMQCQTRVSNTGDQGFALAPKIEQVEAGDTIKMYLGNWSGQDNVVYGGEDCTYLTVKYIN